MDSNSTEKNFAVPKAGIKVAGLIAEHTVNAAGHIIDGAGNLALSATSAVLEGTEQTFRAVKIHSFKRSRFQKSIKPSEIPVKLGSGMLGIGAQVAETTASTVQKVVDETNKFKATRRTVGAALIGLGAKIALDKYLPQQPTAVHGEEITPPPSVAEPLPKLETDFPLYNLKELYNWKKVKQYETIRKASVDILKLRPNSDERANLEYTLFEKLTTELNKGNADISDVLLTLEMSATVKGRNYGLELIWQARQNGLLEKYGLDKLGDERVKWAKDNDIDPRMLAMAGDARKMVLHILMSDPYMFLEQGIKPPSQWTEEDKSSLVDKIPNAGMIAMLMKTETEAYKNIGTDWAIKHLNPEVFASGPADLQAIAGKLKEQTGFEVTKDNIPGSERGNPLYNLSGGAIGPQFMPLLWRVFELKYNETNKKRTNKFPPLSPFDPIMGTMMATLYLSSYFNHREGLANGKWVKDDSTLRIGYENEYLNLFIKYPQLLQFEKIEDKKWASRSKLYQVIAKWNPWHPQIIQVIEAAITYEKSFPKKS